MCPSYLLCLTSANAPNIGTDDGRFLRKCSHCEWRILFYPDSRNIVDSDDNLQGLFYEDIEGGRVLRGCLIHEEDAFFGEEDYKCPMCRKAEADMNKKLAGLV
jgi:hypothetical protein